jgi:hypothetical protein
LKGVANNNYKLSGSLTQTNAVCSKGADKSLQSLSAHGNLNKKYCQSGNKALSADCDTDGFGLKDKILDGAATDVTSKPGERVNAEVNDVIRKAISRSIS